MQRIRERTLRWLRKRGLLDERPNEERSNEAPERSALDACAEIALRGGEFVRIEDETVVPPDDGGEARFEPKRRGPLTVELDGFNVEAAVRIEGYDDEGRERLVRYYARPCFAVERLSILRDGRVAYQVKYPRRTGTHRVMTPIVFLARLAALVPPRHPLVRYHGVLAPHTKQRSVVVPKATGKACKREQRAGADSASSDDKKTTITPMPTRQAPRGRARGMAKPSRRGDERSEAAPSAVSERGARDVAVGALLTMVHGEVERERVSTALGAVLPWADVGFVSEGISVRHLDRLLDGLLLATSLRVEWAKLLRRTYAVDALACLRCSGRMRLMAAITDKATARKILSHLGLFAESLECRARYPADPA
ncbi:transposase [Sorangium sp. So ce185]|uniref:transposase n=1 Tax=Sorangium sp. So ce185 TaxID=3133287 RepID=UPI003F61D982